MHISNISVCQVCLKDMTFFYMINSGSAVTNSPNSDIIDAIHKLVKYLEITHGVKVQKVRQSSFLLHFFALNCYYEIRSIKCIAKRNSTL